jgi:hypothetical protein
MKIKLQPNKWSNKQIPLLVIHHRLLNTDPTYKFIIYANINGRSNITVRRDSSDNDYYDLMNMSVAQDTVISGAHWLEYIRQNFSLSLELGSVAQSQRLPELVFQDFASRDVFDTIFDTVNGNLILQSEGVNVLVDFGIKISGGFIRNKLFLDTNNIKKWLLNNINFSLLKNILENDGDNFVVKDIYKEIYSLSKEDIELLELLGNKNTKIFPQKNNINIFWDYISKYNQATNIETKEAIFNFKATGVLLQTVNTKNISYALDQYNRPIAISTQLKFDHQQQKAYVVKKTGAQIPISTTVEKDSILKREVETAPNSKNINTKINSHIYMVNKK